MPQTLTTGLSPTLRKTFEAFLGNNPQEHFTFKLVDSGAHEMPIQGDGGRLIPTPVYRTQLVSGTTKIRLPEGGPQVALVYSKSTEDKMVNGVMTTVDIPTAILFDRDRRSEVTVARYDEEQLIRLLFSDECRNGINPARNRAVESVYELIEPQKSAADKAKFNRLVDSALAKVSVASPTELSLACEQLLLGVSTDENENYDNLRSAATVNPQQVFDALNGEYDKHTALVRDMLATGVVEFDQNARTFLVNPARTNLLLVPEGAHEQALVKYLIETPEGKKIKLSLIKLLEDKNKKRK